MSVPGSEKISLVLFLTLSVENVVGFLATYGSKNRVQIRLQLCVVYAHHL